VEEEGEPAVTAARLSVEQEAVVKVATDPRPSKEEDTPHAWVRVGVAGGADGLPYASND
jgi:hypothetical protein